ncbi:MAG: US12 family protein [Clostridia bacterium]|nr:US12 family protein [Clostridia bacterium]
MNSSSELQGYTTYRDGANELSESRYNLTIGLTLAWGFLLNFLTVRLAGPKIIEMLYRNPDQYSNLMLGFLVAYFALVIGGARLLRSESPLTCFIGYNLIAVPVGVVLTTAVIQYDPYLVYRACLYTAIITLLMMIAATLYPRFFAQVGGGLGVALLATIIVELAAMLLFRQDLTITDWIVVGIMALYVGYDWTRANAVQRTATNAIAAAAELYLDIINILIRLMRILSRSKERN